MIESKEVAFGVNQKMIKSDVLYYFSIFVKTNKQTNKQTNEGSRSKSLCLINELVV